MFCCKNKSEELVDIIVTKPWDLTPQQIKQLPRNYIERLDASDLDKIWEHLPAKYKNDKKLQLQLPCYEHYNRPEHRDHIDGPPPSKAACWMCPKT